MSTVIKTLLVLLWLILLLCIGALGLLLTFFSGIYVVPLGLATLTAILAWFCLLFWLLCRKQPAGRHFRLAAGALFALALAVCGSAAGQELHGANNAYLGKIQSNGAVFNAKNAQIGRIAADGQVYGANNKLLGKITANGQVYGPNNAYLGKIAADGQVYGARNNLLGKIDGQGGVHAANNALIGKAKGVTPHWAAAYFFFFFKE